MIKISERDQIEFANAFTKAFMSGLKETCDVIEKKKTQEIGFTASRHSNGKTFHIIVKQNGETVKEVKKSKHGYNWAIVMTDEGKTKYVYFSTTYEGAVKHNGGLGGWFCIKHIIPIGEK